MRYFGVRTTAVATQGSGMAAAATELSRTASASVFTECVSLGCGRAARPRAAALGATL